MFICVNVLHVDSVNVLHVDSVNVLHVDSGTLISSLDLKQRLMSNCFYSEIVNNVMKDYRVSLNLFPHFLTVFFLFSFQLHHQEKILSFDFMTNYIHIEWSTNTINTLLHFFGAISRVRRMSEKQPTLTNTSRPSILQNFIVDIKLDMSNINLLIGNNNKGKNMLSFLPFYYLRGHHGSDRMILEFTTTCAKNQCLSPLKLCV